MERVIQIGLMLGLAVVGLGCQGDTGGPKTYQVTGNVTLDGEPVPAGDILFIGTSPGQKPYAGKIIDGKYTLRSEAGERRVEISSMQVVPGKKGIGGTPGDNVPGDVIEEMIPAKYNRDTTLTADVETSGANSFDFELETE